MTKNMFMIVPFSERNFSLALNENLVGPEDMHLTCRSSKHSVNSVIKLAKSKLDLT